MRLQPPGRCCRDRFGFLAQRAGGEPGRAAWPGPASQPSGQRPPRRSPSRCPSIPRLPHRRRTGSSWPAGRPATRNSSATSSSMTARRTQAGMAGIMREAESYLPGPEQLTAPRQPPDQLRRAVIGDWTSPFLSVSIPRRRHPVGRHGRPADAVRPLVTGLGRPPGAATSSATAAQAAWCTRRCAASTETARERTAAPQPAALRQFLLAEAGRLPVLPE
jgi:hypothetical protein